MPAKGSGLITLWFYWLYKMPYAFYRAYGFFTEQMRKKQA